MRRSEIFIFKDVENIIEDSQNEFPVIHCDRLSVLVADEGMRNVYWNVDVAHSLLMVSEQRAKRLGGGCGLIHFVVS